MALSSESFDACFRERYPALVQVVHGLMGDRAAAEDVAQEAFVRLWQRGPSSRPDADYWLFRAARNLALDATKTGRRRAQREAEHVPTAEAPRFDETEVERVRALVNELPPADREVLMLREFGGLSNEVIAEMCRRSTDAVKQQLFRARRRLRREWFARYGER